MRLMRSSKCVMKIISCNELLQWHVALIFFSKKIIKKYLRTNEIDSVNTTLQMLLITIALKQIIGTHYCNTTQFFKV